MKITGYDGPMDPHRLAELRSLAYHRAVCDRLRADSSLVGEAQARIERWRATGDVHLHYVDRWTEWLSLPLEALCEALTADSEEATAMRQVTPFAGTLKPRERWAIWRDIRAQQQDANT